MIDLLREQENSEQVHRFSGQSFVGQGFITITGKIEPKVEKNSGTKSVVSGSDERGLRGVKTTGFLRFYYSNIGRWISRDPIEEDGGVDLYGFLSNDVLSHIDMLGLADIIISLNRASADYFGVYGTLNISLTDNKKICCEPPQGILTIESPNGSYLKSGDTKVKTYPLQTPHSTIPDPLHRGTHTAPARVLGNAKFPFKQDGVSDEDYADALNSSIFIGQGTVAIHAGNWSADSLLCILVGSKYVNVKVNNDQPYPHTKLNAIYLVRGFNALQTQMKLNLFVICVEKQLGHKPTLEFRRNGSPSVPSNQPDPVSTK